MIWFTTTSTSLGEYFIIAFPCSLYAAAADVRITQCAASSALSVHALPGECRVCQGGGTGIPHRLLIVSRNLLKTIQLFNTIHFLPNMETLLGLGL